MFLWFFSLKINEIRKEILPALRAKKGQKISRLCRELPQSGKKKGVGIFAASPQGKRKRAKGAVYSMWNELFRGLQIQFFF